MQRCFHALMPTVIGGLGPSTGDGAMGWKRPTWWWLAVVFVVMAGPLLAAEIDKKGNGAPVFFDIPAQPLAVALVAYGGVTGLEVYYDGTLAEGRRSATVEGVLSPISGLETLLRGTGYMPKVTGPDTVTIVPGVVPALSAKASVTLIKQHEPYFAALQTLISDALCRMDTGAPRRIIVSVWVSASGVISRVEIPGSTGDTAHDAAITTSLQGTGIGMAPPLELPQPVTLAIYPPAAGESPGCASATDSPRSP